MANSDEVARGTLVLDVEMNNSQLQAKLGNIASRLQEIGGQGGKMATSLSNAFNNAASVVGKSMLGALTLAGGGLVSLATKSINLGVSFNILQQRARGALGAILQSAKAAGTLLDAVNKLNDTSPFPREAFIQATQQLAAFGVSAKKIPPLLDGIQQAVASIGGDKNDILQISNSLAQVAAQGHLTGEALFTLGQKGINAAQVIGDAMGLTAQEVKDQVANGAIDADTALTDLADGLVKKFKGATDTLKSTTVTGSLDAFHAVIRNIGGDLTKAFINPLGGGAFITGLNNITDGLSSIRKVLIPVLLPAIQSLADLFVRVSVSVKDFGASLNTTGVSNFVNQIKVLAPLLTFFATDALGGIVSRIPLLAGFANAFNPLVLAFGVLFGSSSKFRDSLKDIGTTLTPIVTELFPKLTGFIGTIEGSISAIGGVVAGVISTIAPLLNLLNFGPVTTLLEIFIARMILLKVNAVGIFQGIAVGIGQMVLSLREAVASTEEETVALGFMGTAGKVAGLAASGIGTALAGLLSPANIALGVFVLISQEMQRVKNAADKLVASTSKGLSAGTSQEDLQIEIERTNKAITEQQKIIHDQTHGVTGLLSNLNVGGLKGAEKFDKATKSVSELKKHLEELAKIGDLKTGLGATVAESTGESVDEAIKRAIASGIDFANFASDQIPNAAKKLIAAFKDTGEVIDPLVANFEKLKTVASGTDAAIQAGIAVRDTQRSLDEVRRQSVPRAIAVRDAQRELDAVNLKISRSAQQASDAEFALQRAHEGVTDAAQHLVEAEHRRALVLADTGAGAREVADADEALFNTRSRLRDLDEEEVSLNRDLQQIALTSADKIAAADRNVERQTIAVNKAKREEQNLLNQINADQIGKIDLTGLSVDEIRTKLANTRASLDASQRIDQVAVTTLAEQQTEAHLSTLDAEQQLKDTVAARAQIEIDLGEKKREDEERLAALQKEREDGKRREIEQQNTLNDLNAGNTQHARDLLDTERGVRDAKNEQVTAANGVRDATQSITDLVIAQKGFTDELTKAQGALETAKRTQKQLAEDIRDAERAVKQAQIDQKTKMAELIEDHKTINSLLVQRIVLNKSLFSNLSDEQAKSTKTEFAGALPALLSGAVGISNGIPIDSTKLSPDFVKGLSQQILDTPGNDVLKILKQVLAQIGLKIPGLAQGAVVNTETIARIGEAGREVVLPLTRPARLAELLAHQQVLPPVLAALQRIHLPDPVGRTPQNFGSSFNLDQMGIRPGFSGSGGSIITADHWEHDVLTELRGLRDDISRLDAGSTELKFELQNTEQTALTRQMRREIERMIAERRR